MLDEHDPITPESLDATNSGSPAIPVARPIGPVPLDPATTCTPDLMLLSSTPKSAAADIGILIALLVLTDFCVGIALVAIAGMFSLSEDAAPAAMEKALLVPMLAVRTAATLVIITLILRRRGQTARSIGLQWSGFGWDVLIGLGAAAAASAFIMALQSTLLLIWPELIEEMNRNADRLLDMVPRLEPLGFAGIALMIGICEELLFRGFLMTRLRRVSGSWIIAVAVSTAVFALLHMVDQEAVALMPVVILSLVFSLVTIWRRSIVPAIVGHAVFDLGSFLLLYYFLEPV